MGLTCQLGFYCLIYAGREYLDKGFELQVTSNLHIAQSLGVGECSALPMSMYWGNKHCLGSGVQAGHGRGAWGCPWALCLCQVVLGRARTQSFCIVLPASSPERLPTGRRVNKSGISMSVMVTPKQPLYTSRSQNTFEEGDWSLLSQEMIMHR